MADGGHISHSTARKALAIAVGLALLFVVLFSVPYLVSASNHVCTDENCPICLCILRFANNLRQIGNGGTAQAFCFILLVLCLFLLAKKGRRNALRSLFLWKVRLNN